MTDGIGISLVSAKAFLAQYAKHISFAAIFGLLGLLTALFDVNTAPEPSNVMGEWILPNDNPVTLTTSLEDMLASPLFGGKPVLKTPPEADIVGAETGESEKWRLIGILTEGTMKTVLFENHETGEVEEAILGDLLPGGEELKVIDANSIVVMQDNESIQMSLFQGVDETEAEE